MRRLMILLGLVAMPVMALPPTLGTYRDAAGQPQQVEGVTQIDALGNAIPVYDAPYSGETAMTVGNTYAVGRSLKANCTGTGNVAVTYSDASTGTWVVVAIGTQVWPIAITAVNTSGTTATCTYASLK